MGFPYYILMKSATFDDVSPLILFRPTDFPNNFFIFSDCFNIGLMETLQF